jgi:hypothetical protein
MCNSCLMYNGVSGSMCMFMISVCVLNCTYVCINSFSYLVCVCTCVCMRAFVHACKSTHAHVCIYMLSLCLYRDTVGW